MKRIIGIFAVSSAVLLFAICYHPGSNGIYEQFRRLFYPPEVEMKETFGPSESQANSQTSFDHSIFDQILNQHVDDNGNVSYTRLKQKSERLLDRYIDSLAKAPLDKLGRDEKLALLINAYNAFTLKLILEHWPVSSIRDIPESKRWKHERWIVGENTLSLDQIEHELIRPNFIEPRIHFAVNCAAISCPPLRNEAYVASKLDRQLEDQSVYVHQRPQWFVFDSQNPEKVSLTQLYRWYHGDFEQAAGSLLNYAAQWSEDLKRTLSSGERPEIEWLEYDWSINGD